MARTAASLGERVRITDYISLGVITKAFPEKAIRAALSEHGKTSIRERDLPAHVVMYYVIAQALFMQISQREVLRCLLEGVRWLFGSKVSVKVTGKSGISQARTRLGWEAVKRLHDDVVAPIAVKKTQGAWYRKWRLISLGTGARWMWPIPKIIEKRLGGLVRVEAVPLIHRFGLCPWWRTAHTCYSERKWRVTLTVKSRWPNSS